jgi:hypothetical protein
MAKFAMIWDTSSFERPVSTASDTASVSICCAMGEPEGALTAGEGSGLTTAAAVVLTDDFLRATRKINFEPQRTHSRNGTRPVDSSFRKK